MQDTQPEQIEVRAAIHLPLDELESMGLSLYWAIAPRQMQGSFDRFPIACESGGEAAQSGLPASFQPHRPCGKIATANDTEEFLAKVRELADLGRSTIEFVVMGQFESTIFERTVVQKRPDLFRPADL